MQKKQKKLISAIFGHALQLLALNCVVKAAVTTWL